MGAFSLIVVINLLNRSRMSFSFYSCCRLCVQSLFYRSLQKRARSNSIRYFGDNFKSNKPAVLIRDTPPRLVEAEAAPLYKYRDEFKDEALKNASDWLSRDWHHQLFVQGEEETYSANFEKYKSEYLEYIRKIQDELTTHSRSSSSDLSESGRYSDSIDASVMQLNDKWNSEIQQLREQCETSSSALLKGRRPKFVTASKGIENTENYISKLLQVKSERLQNTVTEANLDERIELALNETIHDFNFAVDNYGTIHRGTKFDRPRVREMNEMFAAGFSRDLINNYPSFKDAAAQLEFEDDETQNILESEEVLQELGDIFDDKHIQ